jgi:CHAT domain-containing protein
MSKIISLIFLYNKKMPYSEIAEQLISADSNSQRKDILAKFPDFDPLKLAFELKETYYKSWTTEPAKVQNAEFALQNLVELNPLDEIKALSLWVSGIAEITRGNLESAVNKLDKSADSFLIINKSHEAAKTQIGKLYALALLGRYDEAVACGLQARQVFLDYDDIYSVGKIEHNIGNLYWRRDFYAESEPYLISAHQRFTQINDEPQLAMVENCQAFVKALQNNFIDAEIIYKQALNRCKTDSLTVTEAEIEIGMSNLYLFQGNFNLALKFLERARKKYDSLGMPHQSANCQFEIADIYLELNLLPEAQEFYQLSAKTFSEFGMQSELGKCFLNLAKTLNLLNENEESLNYLIKAEKVFTAEGNEISIASVKFYEAQILFGENKIKAAETKAKKVLSSFKKGKNIRFELLGKWFLCEIYKTQGKFTEASKILVETLKSAENSLPQTEYLCLVSLGEITKNKEFLIKAVKLIENSRTMLSAEELRTSFSSDKLLPYNELIKLSLSENNLSEALSWIERSRSRTLLETMQGSKNIESQDAELADLRRELNWFYSRLYRETVSGLEVKNQKQSLRDEINLREKEYAEKLRRRQTVANIEFNEIDIFDLADLQKNLGEKTLIDYILLNEKISAFVVTENNIEFVEDIAVEKEVNIEIEQFLFQIKTARFQDKLSADNIKTAYARMLKHSQKLHNLLIQPLLQRIKSAQLVIIPCKYLHYLSFQALHNGNNFLVEDFEISYSPSASVWQKCSDRQFSSIGKALFVGVADERTPLIKTEIESLSKLFKKSNSLINEKATIENLQQNLAENSILHLACHGKFRADNPSFSFLKLYNQNLLINDTQNLNLKDCLVVLSACETGLSKIIAGEELIGISRGFLSAGASSLVLSLWAVNDSATLTLMQNFYQNILSKLSPQKSLQLAQIQLLKENSHPYFWSPFVIIGG